MIAPETGRPARVGFRARELLPLAAGLAVLAGVFVVGLPADFSWGDHTVYFYRIVDADGIGLNARDYSLWAIAGKPFLALWPGLTGYHVYLTFLWVFQLAVLYPVLRFLGAGRRLALALVFAHGLGYPMRSVGLVSSPKIFWLLTFDLLVVLLVRLERRRSWGRLAAVVGVWAVSTLAHRFGIIAAMPLFLSLALCWPNRKLWLTLAGIAGIVVAAMAGVMLTSSDGHSAVWGFFASHFQLTVPRDWGRTLAMIGNVFVASGLVGGIALLGSVRGLRWVRPAVVFLVTFCVGVLAFAILFPTGEKAMFILPVLQSLLFLAAMAASEPLRGEVWKSAAIAAGGALTLLLLPTLVRYGADVPHLESPYHDYDDGLFGMATPRPGFRYARDVVAALPSGSVVHGDWGIRPMIRALVRRGEMPEGVYLAKETEPPDPEGRLRHYYVVVPWMDLPGMVGPVNCFPVPDLCAKGLRVGRLLLLDR